MRRALLCLATAISLAAFTPQAEACSIRGTYCSYPSWAANAFEGPYGFRGPASSLTIQYPKPSARYSARNRRK